jgi:hypothetical protein
VRMEGVYIVWYFIFEHGMALQVRRYIRRAPEVGLRGSGTSMVVLQVYDARFDDSDILLWSTQACISGGFDAEGK